MKTEPLTYNEAVEVFLRLFGDKRATADQPNRSLSELRGTTWFLRNINGPLARVNCDGEIRVGKIED